LFPYAAFYLLNEKEISGSLLSPCQGQRSVPCAHLITGRSLFFSKFVVNGKRRRRERAKIEK
jgi:hypothetical protein